MKRHRIPDQDLQRALNEVREVYADLSLRPIERNCVRVKECCHFKLTGRTPYLTKGEALLAAKALRATGRTQLPENATGACPLLDSTSGNCLIYESRPFRLPHPFLRGRRRPLRAPRSHRSHSPAGNDRCDTSRIRSASFAKRHDRRARESENLT